MIVTDIVVKPAYTYGALITGIYDGDTIITEIDWGKNHWTKDEVIRLYGINCNEIKKSTAHGRGQDHVDTGYDHRDALIRAIGLNADNFPRKVKYQDVSKSILRALDLDGDGEPDFFEYVEYPAPVRVVIQTIKDDTGKFGRLLGIIHTLEGVNVNEHLSDIIGGVEFYDGKTYPADYPIRPPD